MGVRTILSRVHTGVSRSEALGTPRKDDFYGEVTCHPRTGPSPSGPWVSRPETGTRRLRDRENLSLYRRRRLKYHFLHCNRTRRSSSPPLHYTRPPKSYSRDLGPEPRPRFTLTSTSVRVSHSFPSLHPSFSSSTRPLPASGPSGVRGSRSQKMVFFVPGTGDRTGSLVGTVHFCAPEHCSARMRWRAGRTRVGWGPRPSVYGPAPVVVRPPVDVREHRPPPRRRPLPRGLPAEGCVFGGDALPAGQEVAIQPAVKRLSHPTQYLSLGSPPRLSGVPVPCPRRAVNTWYSIEVRAVVVRRRGSWG